MTDIRKQPPGILITNTPGGCLYAFDMVRV